MQQLHQSKEGEKGQGECWSAGFKFICGLNFCDACYIILPDACQGYLSNKMRFETSPLVIRLTSLLPPQHRIDTLPTLLPQERPVKNYANRLSDCWSSKPFETTIPGHKWSTIKRQEGNQTEPASRTFFAQESSRIASLSHWSHLSLLIVVADRPVIDSRPWRISLLRVFQHSCVVQEVAAWCLTPSVHWTSSICLDLSVTQ